MSKVFQNILFLWFCGCRKSVKWLSELGAGGSAEPPAFEARPHCYSDHQHQSQVGLFWSGKSAAGSQ